jgi:hypothetical protein
VGVESIVVDGLSDPLAILQLGGIGIEEVRALGGRWKDVTIGYQDRKQDADLTTHPEGHCFYSKQVFQKQSFEIE